MANPKVVKPMWGCSPPTAHVLPGFNDGVVSSLFFPVSLLSSPSMAASVMIADGIHEYFRSPYSHLFFQVTLHGSEGDAWDPVVAPGSLIWDGRDPQF